MLLNTTTGIPVGKIDGLTLEATNPFPFPAVDVTAHDGHHDKEHVTVAPAEFAVVWMEPVDLQKAPVCTRDSVGGLLRCKKWMRSMECDRPEDADSMGMSILIYMMVFYI